MKQIKIIYWIATILIAGLMLFSGVTNAMSTKEALDVFKALGYPAYLSPFLGIAKILGAITLLVPGFPRLKEWAYAGITFDLLGAAYSGVAVGGPLSGLLFFVVIFAVLAVSYIYHHKKLKAFPIPAPAL
jgi:uncharacterized membrane protein YphA (DoxX/SURF4 family)